MLELFLLVNTVFSAHGALQFAFYYQDHMVLQRGPQQAVVWGNATKIGDSVTVQVSGRWSVTGKVTKDEAGHGMWKVKLPPITDKGPFNVTATSSEGTATINDVLFGDVWLCSGQSNMEFPFSAILNRSDELADALAYPEVRFMRVHHFTSNTPLTDLAQLDMNWTHAQSIRISYDIYHFSAVCWFYGKYLYSNIKYPIGLIESNWGGTPIEPWSSPDALAVCAKQGKRAMPHQPSVLWNAMISPFLRMTLYGAIWYQGEANANHADLYACQFPAMINDWRKKFHEASLGQTSAEFPFGFVQLAAFHESNTTIGGFPPLRWAQTANMGEVPNTVLKNVFMSVAMDLPDFSSPRGSIHPRYKQDVARRLELAARAVAYDDKAVKYQGPFPKTIMEDKTHHTLHIVYDHGPIEVKNNHGFEVCCSTGPRCNLHDQWVPAPIQSNQTSDVVVDTSSCGTKNTVGVRYEWRESPCAYKQCAIYGRDTSLPAPPYINTDGFGIGSSIVGK